MEFFNREPGKGPDMGSSVNSPPRTSATSRSRTCWRSSGRRSRSWGAPAHRPRRRPSPHGVALVLQPRLLGDRSGTGIRQGRGQPGGGPAVHGGHHLRVGQARGRSGVRHAPQRRRRAADGGRPAVHRPTPTAAAVQHPLDRPERGRRGAGGRSDGLAAGQRGVERWTSTAYRGDHSMVC